MIVTDDNISSRIAKVAAQAVSEHDGEPVIVLMKTLPLPNAEPPPTVAAAMREADVIFGFLSKSIFHTRARVAATQKGARMISVTGIVEEPFQEALSRLIFLILNQLWTIWLRLFLQESRFK